VVFAFNNNERRDRPALGIDALDYRSPFPIARLGQFRLAFPIRACNNHQCGNLTHHKAGFVKIVDIGISDSVLRDRVAHKVKPALNQLWIFA
jgi:hypothetical protein